MNSLYVRDGSSGGLVTGARACSVATSGVDDVTIAVDGAHVDLAA